MKHSHTEALTRRTKVFARQLGFDAVGICDLSPIRRPALAEWLERGFAGQMLYMHRQAARRMQPARIAPGCTRAIVALKNYYQGEAKERSRKARIARYAWGDDYHVVMGEALDSLAAFLVQLGASRNRTRWFVDAGPVPERELAQRAGLGWMGKNTLLINSRVGSFTFIGAVFTDLDLEVDRPFGADRCGGCRRCLEACPTGALVKGRLLDSRLCISYLTIEHRGEFAAGGGKLIGDWLFGCDLCQEVCPWNRKFAAVTGEGRFLGRREVLGYPVRDVVEIDERSFERRYKGTALERAGFFGLRRNARQVMVNTGQCGAGARPVPRG